MGLTPLFKFMYRHETTAAPNAPATQIVGFEDNPSELFLQEMQKTVPNMQDLPFYRQGIECFCPKFVLFEEQWIGTVLTPWMISVLVLPGPGQTWEARELGDKLNVQLPYKALTFTVSGLEQIPQYLSCSLQSPLDPGLSNLQAKQLTQDCLRMVLSINAEQPKLNQNRRNLFQAMLK